MRHLRRLRLGFLKAGVWVTAILAAAGAIASAARPAALRGQDNSTQAPPSQELPAQPETKAPPENQVVTLPAGTTISVRLADTVNSNRNRAGDFFSGTVDPSLLVDNRVVIPRGTEAHLRLMRDKKGGHLHGRAEVRLELVGLVLNGRKLSVDSSAYDKKKGVLSSKIEAEAEPSARATAGVALAGDPSGVGGPVIAVFRAAKVVKPAGSRIEFRLLAPFTFQQVPVEGRS